MLDIKYTRIMKIGNMYFEEVEPEQAFTLTRVFTLEEAVQLGCHGVLNPPQRRETKAVKGNEQNTVSST